MKRVAVYHRAAARRHSRLGKMCNRLAVCVRRAVRRGKDVHATHPWGRPLSRSLCRRRWQSRLAPDTDGWQGALTIRMVFQEGYAGCTATLESMASGIRQKSRKSPGKSSGNRANHRGESPLANHQANHQELEVIIEIIFVIHESDFRD